MNSTKPSTHGYSTLVLSLAPELGPPLHVPPPLSFFLIASQSEDPHSKEDWGRGAKIGRRKFLRHINVDRFQSSTKLEALMQVFTHLTTNLTDPPRLCRLARLSLEVGKATMTPLPPTPSSPFSSLELPVLTLLFSVR